MTTRRATCKTCRFAELRPNGEGECRFHPPTLVVVSVHEDAGVWPSIYDSSWCGHHAALEEAADADR